MVILSRRAYNELIDLAKKTGRLECQLAQLARLRQRRLALSESRERIHSAQRETPAPEEDAGSTSAISRLGFSEPFLGSLSAPGSARGSAGKDTP